ncbi:LysR substrate-binding domain-containing protein [Aureimonas pseudogalii]|uniref:LysR family glycine cleavage system transcriptional activator n=1 Tax=Aureimonas pseudogalii TaxID=1744844 RepID=A0A7W6H974_9HYPH|nr:LysR substrate-binding domain-containing protein [Aureimonas pseudogalii]MBB4000751.1 LysR family glycine cleavage system transcriptional activator [Aureimonas pseudogalii]
MPLTALRSFEAAGRLSSIKNAAGELCVSQAAVSRQVADLERSIGHSLFVRLHRSVVLTDEGRQLLDVLTPSFDQIDDCLSHLTRSMAPAPLKISVEPSFAACWLIPRLGDFQALNPDVELQIDTDSRLCGFRRSEAEMAIRWSRSATSWPRTQASRLVDVTMTPIISPLAVETGLDIRQPCDLLDYPLLHEENRSAWSEWFDQAGIKRLDGLRGPVFSDLGLLLDPVRRGHGAALIDLLFVEDDLRNGRLLRPLPQTMAYGAYWIVARDLSQLSPAAERFASWCRARIHNCVAEISEAV